MTTSLRMTPRAEVELPRLDVAQPGDLLLSEIEIRLEGVRAHRDRLAGYETPGALAQLREEGIPHIERTLTGLKAQERDLLAMRERVNRANAHHMNAERLFDVAKAQAPEVMLYNTIRELLGAPVTKALADSTTSVETLKQLYVQQLELVQWADHTRRPILATEARERVAALAERIRGGAND